MGKLDLEQVEQITKVVYSNGDKYLSINRNEPFDFTNFGNQALAYCNKNDTANANIYNIVAHPIGDDDIDYKIYMHEIGHIYFGHLDEIHEELDSLLIDSINSDFYEISERINKECGIDFGEVLLKRIIDDPSVNHSLHNVAMDLEVNSKLLSEPELEAMEASITNIFQKKVEEALKMTDQISESEKKELEDQLNQATQSSLLKFMHPNRFTTTDGTGNVIPFPEGKSYTEYLLLMIKHADQFIKMLVSINSGGNGDTSKVTKQQIQDALNKWWNNQSEEYRRGYQQGLKDLKNGTAKQKQSNQPGSQSGSGQNGQAGQSQGSQNGQGSQLGGQNGQSGQGQNGGQGSQAGGDQAGQNGQGGQGSQAGSQNGQGQNGGQGSQAGSQNGQSGQGQNGGQGSQNEMSDYERGYQDALRDAANGMNGGSGIMMRGLDSMINGNGSSSGNASGDSNSTSERDLDHGSDERRKADEARANGTIGESSNTDGGSNSMSPGDVHAEMEMNVNKEVDKVEMILREIVQNVKKRVVSYTYSRNVMRLYNRGIDRRVIRPTMSQKVNMNTEIKLVFLIDVSGSMDRNLIQRILVTIPSELNKINRSLKYDIITWDTELENHFKDLTSKDVVPKIEVGGGTRIAKGIKYFKDQYDDTAVLVIISDFEDTLSEWKEVESTMNRYVIYGCNYGSGNRDKATYWTNLKQRNLSYA